jgi:nucleotide-binding universal stress UspA family protein
MMNPKVILSPIDFSDSSLDALDVARDIATRYGAALILVHVVPVIPKLPTDVSIFHEGDYERGLIGDAEQRLAGLAAKLKEQGVTARTTVGLANDAAMEILRTAEQEHADLIVIATHGMTGWRRLAFGSVTDKVVRTAECPVLVLRKSAASNAGDAEEKSASAAA